MKNFTPKNSQSPTSGIRDEFRRWKLNLNIIRAIVFALILGLPVAASAAFSLPAIPSNTDLSRRFELSTELVFRVKLGTAYLPDGTLVASIKGEIRGAQTSSVLFPASGNKVYKIRIFNDKPSGDSISFKYYDITGQKIYDIKEKLEFISYQVPDYANPAILSVYCKPITGASGLIPENGKANLNTTVDLYWQPSPNATTYNLFLWEDGTTMPVTPTNANLSGTTFHLTDLKYGQIYRWKISSSNECLSAESAVQTFKVLNLPDLTVSNITAPVNIESGSNFTISFKVTNIGGGGTAGAAWTDAVYVSTDQTLSVDDKILSNTNNVKQLDADSSYTKTVNVTLPIDYTGDYYFLVKTDAGITVSELLEDNNLGKTASVTHVALKSLPDILVKDIQPGNATVNPGDSLMVNWSVQNIGGSAAIGGWIERISFIPVSGPKLKIDPSFQYMPDLAAGATVNRSKKIKLPGLPKFSGNANLEVELIPFPALQEYPSAQANNKSTSGGQVNVGNLLTLDIQTTSVLENTATPVRCIVTRSGDYSADLQVSMSASLAGQVTIPATVTIPANQSAVVFNLSPINNLIIDGPRNVDITASATDYANSVKTITILDDEIPGLKAQLSKSSATEGETITLTVTRDLVTSSALTVNLSTNKPSQWTFPSSVIIPANVASGDVPVSITDDNIPELTSDATIYASSSGMTSGQVTASIIDNDIPEVSLQILADTISEGAGIYATWGVIKRVKGSDNITVNLTANVNDQIFFPATVVLPKGALEQQFNIGAIDNTMVDGYRRVTLTGSVLISSCNCRTTAQNGGVVTADLVIADNDGPSLSVSVDPISVPEGKLNVGTLTITRNTPTDLALNVNISHNDTTQVKIQPTTTIPAGQRSVRVPIDTKNNYLLSGTQMASIQASAATFTSGFGYFYVTDQNKPDLQITDIALNTSTAATNDLIEITGSALNSGFATAPSGVVINFYCSKDKTLDDSDILLGDFTFPSSIAQGMSANFMKTVAVPAQTGSYYILAKINPAESITELVYFNNVSDAVPLTITPEYNATAIADNNLYLPNTTIPIHGSALNNKSEKVPNADVDVYILSNGTRRELKAKTDNSGNYSVNFVPIPNESGHFIIGACFPKQNLSDSQDTFDIPGLQLGSTSNIIWEMKLGQILIGKIAVRNTSEAPLNHIVITPDKLPLGCELKFDTIAVLSANQTLEFHYTLKATELTSGTNYDNINFHVQSAEGVTIDFPAYYYCQALQGQLKADPVSINTTMTKGKSRLYELHIYNNGAGQTGTVTVSLPNVNWMSLVSPATLTNIAPQDTATVILNLSPTSDMPLNTPISGSIAVNCVNGNGVQVPYQFEVVSQEKGGLKVDVLDEYSYYTEAKPHLKNAHVVVRHPFSGKIMADGFTGDDGTFSVDSLPEGSYKMSVEAEKHEGFQTVINIDPGRVNEQSVFLSFQAITYTWEVVPTTIQDKYDVQLVLKFETNVPVPVVIVDMPTDMPQLVNDQTFPFLITLTNKGLITAKDVDITLPQNDPEYEFVTNFTKTDLLAQQAIQVPVVMQRRAGLKSATTTQAIASSGPCTDYEVTLYGWECGKDKKWNKTGHNITFSGRYCGGSSITTTGPEGPPWFNGWFWPLVPNRTTGGHYWFDPTTLPGAGVGSSTVGCDNCLIDLSLALLGCLPVVGTAANTAGCIKTFAGFGGMSWEFAGDVGLCIAGYIPPVGCLAGLLGALKSCIKDPPILTKSASLIAGIQGNSSVSPIIQQAINDMAYLKYLNDAQVGWMSEVAGGMDWQSKQSFSDFLSQLNSLSVINQPIDQPHLALIKEKMIGTDITSDEIDAFVTRWNNSVIAFNLGIYSPTVDHPGIIDGNLLASYVTKADSAQNYAVSKGYGSVGELFNASQKILKAEVETGRNSVCSTVTINITQKVVMTREAFEGSLTIFNGHTSEAMKEIKLNLEITDENGVPSNDLFQIDTKALSILTGIDGTGTLGPQEKGSATVIFIPEKGAAPTVPKSYSFGGSFSYLDPFTGVTVTKPLFPVTLNVNPSPDLWLHYFMQRDILGDDPLTPAIEPIVPAEFAVMVQNNGYGTANGVRIESAQPKIVENAKGLAINFALIGSNLNGQPRQLGLTNIDFGNIGPKKAAIGQWYFTSDLMGHFVSYEAKVSHIDSHGNPDLSLISGATLHELIKSVDVYSGVEDGINDFLVNEVQDALEFPDVIYLSSGGVLDVYPAVSQSTSGNIASGNHEIELQVTPIQVGWNYIKFSDPGGGNYKIASVTREDDGQVIPLDNVWQTFVTMPDSKEPVYENMMHFLDVFAANSAQKYIIRFTPKDQNPPEIVRFDNVPAAEVTSPLTSVNVVFNRPIDPATFNYEDMTLRIQGGADVMDKTVTVTQLDPVTFKIDLTTKSLENGYYVLTVQASQISSLTGTNGLVGKQATWTQFLNVPAVSEFIGLPDNKVGPPFDLLLLRFNLPIDKTTLLPERFTLKKDGNPVSGTIKVTSMDTEGLLFQLSGLQTMMSQDGKYSLTVDLPNIKTLDGNNGILPQSVDWKIDQTAPLINQIIPSTNGGYDSQHRTAFTVLFSEPVKGVGVANLELWKDGTRQPLSQLDFTMKNDSEYLFTQFRMLTYYDGSYELKVKMKDITDLAGNSRTDTVKYNWIVYRKIPAAVTGLHITPDLGYSDTDNITDTRNLVVSMTVNEPHSRIQIYQTDRVSPVLLADTVNVNSGPLTLPVIFTYGGNITLQAYCIDSYTNQAITEIPVTIDEAALVGTWKNAPASAVAVQPNSLQLEFSDKLLDDTQLKGALKFERDGQSLGNDNLSVSKSTDKLYLVSGMDQAGNAGGTYSLTLDLSKLKKYTSGKEGVSTSSVQWSVTNPNHAPIAVAGVDQSVFENTLVTLDGSGSSDPDSDPLTYHWTAPSGIILSSATDVQPTFTAPEITADETLTFSLIVNDGKANSTVSEVKVTVKNISATIKQSINLSKGWNIISANVTPANPDMLAIFQSLIDGGKLRKAMDEAGNTMEDFGVLGGWTNNIGNLSTDQGYKVYVSELTKLDIEGVPVSLPMDISLNTGWNIIGYPSAQPQDAMTIFQPLIDSGKLIKVMDEAGNTLEDFGVSSGWTNNIGNLMPNKGYKVRMTSAGTLTISAGGTKLAVLPPENLPSGHFRKAYSGNGTDHATINLVDLAKGGLREGDEIGIFDGKICVGSARIGSDQIFRNSISIPASCNDGLESKINGFTPENPIILKLFRNNQEYLVKPDLRKDSRSIFAKGESMFAMINTSLATAILESSESVSVKCYPNPFSDQVTIEIDNPAIQRLEVRVFDLSGKLIRTLYQGTGNEKATMNWDGKNEQGVKMSSGSYLLKANNTVEKIVLSH